jgi:hypothetical protein
LQAPQNGCVTLLITPTSPRAGSWRPSAPHSPSARRSRPARRLQRHQRQLGLQPADHLRAGQHLVHAPAVGGAHVHELDEAQRDAAAAEVPRHRQDLVVVGAALDHHVDLDRPQARGLRGVDAGQHLAHRKATSFMAGTPRHPGCPG